MRPHRPAAARAQRGYALVTAIVFLVLLTLVALSAIRGTGLEVKSTANNTLRAEVFAASEITRTLVGRQIDALCANAGSDGLTAADDPGALRAVPGLRLLAGGDWCLDADAAFVAAPASGPADARYDRSLPPVAHGTAWVQRLYRTTAPGAGQAQAAGYGGAGVGTANGGGEIYFHVYSRGTDRPLADVATADAGYDTAAVYRYVIRR
ncbi:MAG: hypothetical protein C0434_10275 [Xanthomonadaceae bacterium]|nr:hypothetical protein [Xanthomonadaceae bacterium]